MCGLAGIVALDGERVDPSELEAMLASIRHRGPDSQGSLVTGRIALGFRRLRVIDLSPDADQPMLLPDQSLAVVSNGEIYNYRALRNELTALGHPFRTQSDTEVILHAWRQWGVESIARLHGMFAIAVWDQRAGKLTLARDRVGKKPLYFCVGANRLLFASELKALTTSPTFAPSIDLSALKDYLAFGYITGSQCIFRDVRKLPPATTITIDVSSSRAVIGAPQRYWELRVQTRTRPSRAITEPLPELDRLLDTAVQDRMVSDVPIGAFLSGGIDSSLVVSYMAQHARGRVRAFSIGYRGHPSDESRFAALMGKRYGIDHHIHFLDPDDYTDPQVVNDVYDEPFADSSAAATLKLCEVAKKGVTVALSGDGGDELFGGYPRYQSALRVNLLRHVPSARDAARFLLGAVSSARAGELRQALAQSPNRLYSFLLGERPKYLDVLTERAATGLFASGSSSVERLMSQFSHCDLATAMMATDMCGYLPDDILVKVDRASMHFALEVRSPLLDTRLINFAFALPPASKLGLRHTKILLKRLAAQRLPQEIIDRPKQGFMFPLADWLRGPLRAPLESLLLGDGDRQIWTIYRREAVQERFRAHIAQRADASLLCWRVMILANWLDKYAVNTW